MVSPEAFQTGQAPYPGAKFRYTDDVWQWPPQAKRIATSPGGDRLNFADLPAWLKMPAKAYVSWGWLAQDFSLSWLQERLVMLRKLGHFVRQERPDIRQLADLDRGAADGFVQYLRQDTSPGNAHRQACEADQFGHWLRQQYNVAHHFRPRRYATKPRFTGAADSRDESVIPTTVMEQLLSAASRRHTELWTRWANPRARHPRASELLYLQVLRIMAATSLRISQILLMPRITSEHGKPYRLARDGEAPGLWISFRETKTHQGVQERFVPQSLAELVQEALDVALAVTDTLAQEAQELDYVFPTQSKGGAMGGGTVRPISAKAFTVWLNGRHDAEGNVLRPGFIHRHEIRYQGYYYTINPHQSRHTLATRLYLGGAGFGTVVEQLLHRGNMTGVYTHGRDRDIQELQQALDVETVAGGKVAQALLDPDRVLVGAITDGRLKMLKEEGLYLQVTPYGFCTHDQKRGPCNQPELCWRGLQRQACDEAVLLPRGVSQMQEDLATLERQAELWLHDNTPSPFIANVQAARVQYERIVGLLQGQASERPATSPSTPTMVEKRRPRLTLRGHRPGFGRPRQRAMGPKQPINVRYKKYTDLAAERIVREMAQVRDSRTVPTNRAFAQRAGVSPGYLATAFPDVVRELATLRKAGWSRDVADTGYKPAVRSRKRFRLTVDEEALYQQIEDAWAQVVAGDIYPTVSEFAKRAGVDRNVFYNDFPAWGARVRARWEQGMERRKAESREYRRRALVDRAEQRKRNRLVRLNAQLEGAWDFLEAQGEPFSMNRLAHEAHVNPDTLKRDFPQWAGRANRARQAAAQQAQEDMNQILRQAWQSLAEAGEPITVVNLAHRAGIARDAIYDHHPEWVDKVRAFEEEQNRVQREAVQQELARVGSEGRPVTMVAFSQRVEVARTTIQRRYPEVVTALKEHNNEVKKF